MSKVLMWPRRTSVPSLKAPDIRACDGLEESGELDLYRQYTTLLLRRYFRLSVDIGRLPSVLGSQCFRAKVSSYKLHTFEDTVIFVHDMERCVERLSQQNQRLLAGLIFLEYSQNEIADALGLSRVTVVRQVQNALGELARILLEVKLIDATDLKRMRARKEREPVALESKEPSGKRAAKLPPKKPCGRVTCEAPYLLAKAACSGCRKK